MNTRSSQLFFLMLLALYSCKPDWPSPVVSIDYPIENTEVKEGDELKVKVYHESETGIKNMTLSLVDQNLLSLGTQNSWTAAGSESIQTITIPELSETTTELFLKAAIEDGRAENTSYTRLTLLPSDDQLQGWVFVETAGSSHTIIIENLKKERFEIKLQAQELDLWVVNSQLLVLGRNDLGIRSYNLFDGELAWSYPESGALSGDILCESLTDGKIWLVQRGIGVRALSLSTGVLSGGINISNPEFQVDIETQNESLILLEKLNSSQTRLHSYFASTGAFFQDLVVNKPLNDIWVDDIDRIFLTSQSHDTLSFYQYEISSNTMVDIQSPQKKLTDFDSYKLRRGFEWIYALKGAELRMSQANQTTDFIVGSNTLSFYPGVNEDQHLTLQSNRPEFIRIDLSKGLGHSEAFKRRYTPNKPYNMVLSY